MTRNISSTDFLDLFQDTTLAVDDVTRRNANVLVTEPTKDIYGAPSDRIIQINTSAPAWVNLAFFSQTLAVFGGPLLISTRARISAITNDTIFNMSFGIDGVEVTGNEYGLITIDSLNFAPVVEFSHVVTGVPSSTHTISLFANVRPKPGASGIKSATLTMGIVERMTIIEVK